jgi:serine/threonine protein kinase
MSRWDPTTSTRSTWSQNMRSRLVLSSPRKAEASGTKLDLERGTWAHRRWLMAFFFLHAFGGKKCSCCPPFFRTKRIWQIYLTMPKLGFQKAKVCFLLRSSTYDADEEEVKCLMKQLLEGLEYLHRHDIIHRSPYLSLPCSFR